jgi:prepilin-type N-terminal cleavage/methylation domain-containing protein
MAQRNGVTLIEVLVAIFVMAIGLLSLLTLFPLGALSMAQTGKDVRTSQAETNAVATWRYRNMSQDFDPTNQSPPMALQNAFGTPPPNYNPPNMWPPSANNPSFPVYVDPLGANMNSPLLGSWPLGAQNPPLPTAMQQNSPVWRVSTTWIRTGTGKPQDIPRWFSLLDDMDYDKSGIPNPPGVGSPPGLGQVQRGGRYTWAYFCRQPRFSPGNFTGPVEMSVVVYDGRSLQLSPFGQPAGEYAFAAMIPAQSAQAPPGTPQNVMTLAWDPRVQDAPNIRPGRTWILDITVGQAPTAQQGQTPQLDIHGYFYRVVSASQVSSYGQGAANPPLVWGQNTGANPQYTMDLELQTNLRQTFNNQQQQGMVIVMDNVAEVFEMGP